MLTVRLFGTPTVALDGRPISFPFQRVDALLYYLLVCRTVTRREMTALLWESCEESEGLKNLRNALYHLKKELGGELVISPQKSILTINEEWQVDCDYTRLLAEKDFSLYTGEFLQGFSVKNAFSYEEWIQRTREKLQGEYLSALERTMDAAEAVGDFAEAIRKAQLFLQGDPYNETISCRLLSLYRRTAQYVKVPLEYQRLRGVLEEELGVAPIEATTNLYYEILNEWNDIGRDDAPLGYRVPIGREELFSQLRAATLSFRNGENRRCSQLLRGHSGAGKSELLAAYRQSLATGQDKILLLSTGCFPSETQQPLCPWDTLMLSLARAVNEWKLPLSPSVRQNLAVAFPIFGEGEGEATDRTVTPALAEAVVLLFGALASRRQLLLLWEDLEWADGESLLLLDALLRRMEPRDLMAVISCRDFCRAGVQDFITRADRDGLLRPRALPPLEREQAERLLTDLLGRAVTEEELTLFHTETNGNAYLLTELATAYRGNPNFLEIRRSLGRLLLDQLKDFSDAATEAAKLMSLFPEAAPRSALLWLAGENPHLLHDGLEELCQRGLVVETETATDTEYRFSQTALQSLLYREQGYLWRRQLHRRLARQLEETNAHPDGETCRQIAYHYRQSKGTTEALLFELRALDLETALCCESFPIEANPETPPPSFAALSAQLSRTERELAGLLAREEGSPLLARAKRLLTLIEGRMALFSGNIEAGNALLGSLSVPQDGRQDDAIFLQSCRLLGEYALFSQSRERLDRYSHTGLRVLERYDDPVELAMFEQLRGDYFCLVGEYDKSIYYLLEAADAFAALPRAACYRWKRAGVCCDLGRVYRQKKDFPLACSYFKRALALIEGAIPRPGAAWIYLHYARTTLALEDSFRTRSLFAAGYAAGQTTGERFGVAINAAFTAHYALLDGDYTRAAATLADAERLVTDSQSPLERALLLLVKAEMRQQLSREQCVDPSLGSLLPDSPDYYARTGLRALEGLPDVAERTLLEKSLRSNLAAKENFHSWELYSKNRHFMAE